MRTILLGTAALFVALGAACGSKNTSADAGTDGTDGDVLDAGEDAGSPDAGPAPCDLAQQNCPTGTGTCVRLKTVDGGFGAFCFPGACDLVLQNCPAGNMCDYKLTSGTVTRQCIAEGSVDEGQSCASAPCKRGLTCVALGGSSSQGICLKYCNSNADCSAGKQCRISLSMAGSNEAPMVCADPPQSCSMLLQDCANASDGCYPSSSVPQCFFAGAQTDGGSCQHANDCQKGSTCVSGGVCRTICQYPSGAPTCATGTCQKLNVAGTTNVGACL